MSYKMSTLTFCVVNVDKRCYDFALSTSGATIFTLKKGMLSMKIRKANVSVAALAAALSFSLPAFAQAGSDAALPDGEIVVTATRNETLASKTPVALTAVSGDALISAGITNPTNLGDQVPNLSIDRSNGLQITIRGVSSSDGTEKGDPSAAFMVDGIYIARPQAQEVSFYDLQRV